MSSDAREWDGEVIGSGAVVLLPEEPTASAPARLVAGSEDVTPVAFSVSRLSDFIGAHPDAVFFSPDSAPLLTAGASEPGLVQRGAVVISAALDAGYWIDLGLLDLLLRVSAGDSVFKPRTEEELVRHFGQNVGEAVENRSQISPISSENPPHRDRIDRLLNIACHLAVRAVDMAAETERPREPEYRLGDPHAAYLAFVHDLSPAAREAFLAPPKPTGPAEPSELQLLREAVERLEARLLPPAPSAPPVALPGLVDAAKAARLSGAQQRTVDEIARSGRMSLSELAVLAGVDDLLGVLKRAKPKLKKVGWALFRHDNHIEAKPIPGGRK